MGAEALVGAGVAVVVSFVGVAVGAVVSFVGA